MDNNSQPSTPTGVAPQESPAPGGEERVNILVVDDLPDKILVYRAILEELGHNLMTAQSGEEALKLVLRHEFAVILLDVNMPGTDGFETATLIRARRKSAHTPIIFLTAFTESMYAEQGYASGAVDYLPTPVVPDILRAKVRVFIELHQMRRQAALQAEERVKRAAAEEMAARSSFIVTASEVFARAQNQEDILGALAKVSIPYLADIGIAWFTDKTMQSSHLRWAWTPAQGEAACESLPASWAAFPWLKKLANRTIGRNKVKVFEQLPVAPVTQAGPVMPSFGPTMVLPLTLRHEACGVLVLARRAGAPPYAPSAVASAGDLVSRAGVALENIMLMERIKQADRRKDEFLGMLAHELRNPLGPVCYAAQLLRMLAPGDARFEKIRDIIDRQVTHMSRLIDDLLDATRLARGKFLLRKEQCNLTAIVRQTAEDYQSIFDGSGLRLEIDVPDYPMWVMGDPTRLVQSVGNLLHNAHKFTNPGGEVTVRLKAEKGGNAAAISIRDTGIGIAPDVLPSVFDVFSQAEQALDRSRGGLGLGLALVKGFIGLHGGEVAATSDGMQKGAEFTIRLPVIHAVAPAVKAEPLTFTKNLFKDRILVIEDNRDTAESARLLLSMEGYDVHVAHNGSIGIEMAKEFHPKVILCDIGLPGMDGYQVVRALRQAKDLPAMYVIALTGYGRDEDQRQAHEAGFDMHLTKPIDFGNLRRMLTSLSMRDDGAAKENRSN